MKEIKPEEVKSLVNKLGPSLGYDFTSSPVFPKTRKDICAVVRTAENGSTYGFDTLYLVWSGKKDLDYEKLKDTRSSKDYIHIGEVTEKKKIYLLK